MPSPKRIQHELPEIFRYLEYATWLGAVFEALQASDSEMTHRRFSKQCGYQSAGAMSLIISGKRRISDAGARRIAKALRLTAAERDHLLLMVAYEQADSFEERQRLLKKMAAAKRFADEWQRSISSFEFYGSWHLPVVREIVSLDGFVEDPKWIARAVHGRMTPTQAEKAIETLLRLGHLERDSTGKLRPTQNIIATPSEVRSDVLKQHQRDMMTLAGEALDSQDPEMRDMRVATVAISENQAARIKALLTQLQKEMLAIVAEDEPIETVYQLNTQWFALTNRLDEGEEK